MRRVDLTSAETLLVDSCYALYAAKAMAFALETFRQLAACETLASQIKTATCSRLSTVRFANGPKRSMGHVPGAEKGNFLIRGAEADEATGRPRRWNPVNPCWGGVPGVA